MQAVELFAGTVGLALGVSLAGFESLAVIEWDRWACDTIRDNLKRGYPLVADWPLWEGDVREFDWSAIPKGIDLLAGGPSCQPRKETAEQIIREIRDYLRNNPTPDDSTMITT